MSGLKKVTSQVPLSPLILQCNFPISYKLPRQIPLHKWVLNVVSSTEDAYYSESLHSP